MDAHLKRLGRELRASQSELLSSFDLAAQRARFLAAAHERPHSAGRGRWLVSAVAFAALGLLALWRSPPPVEFEVERMPGREGQWLAAPENGSLRLSFSEGSRFALSDRGRARVVERSARGARIVLERGTLLANVAHRADTRWRVDAGPFAVHVIGTRFRISWNAAREQLQLALYEGTVRVEGPGLPRGRSLVAGDALELQGAGAAGPGSVQQGLREARAVAGAADRDASHGPASAAATPAARAEPAPAARSSAVGALMMRADRARFAGEPAQAAAALVELRARFPSAARARGVAFLLGRLAFDQLDAPAEAARWLAIYLEESPHGAFAREALGRLIECHERVRDRSAARQAAQRYLARYAAGPHAALARAILGARQ